MISLYDELSEKLRQDPRLTRQGGGPRADIGILLFGSRDALRDLWVAAERYDRSLDPEAAAALREAIGKLRPLFGERNGK